MRLSLCSYLMRQVTGNFFIMKTKRDPKANASQQDSVVLPRVTFLWKKLNVLCISK